MRNKRKNMHMQIKKEYANLSDTNLANLNYDFNFPQNMDLFKKEVQNIYFALYFQSACLLSFRKRG